MCGRAQKEKHFAVFSGLAVVVDTALNLFRVVTGWLVKGMFRTASIVSLTM